MTGHGVSDFFTAVNEARQEYIECVLRFEQAREAHVFPQLPDPPSLAVIIYLSWINWRKRSAECKRRLKPSRSANS